MKAWRALVVYLLASASPSDGQSYQHILPEATGDGWAVGTLESVDLDPDLIKDVITQLGYNHGTNDLRSILVARHGELVVEQYLNSYAVDTIHDVRSAGKTFTGALVGIAVDQGLIASVDSLVLSFFDSASPIANRSGEKDAMKVGDLLTMSSGLDADAYNPQTPGHELHLKQADDFTRFVLDLPMAFQPGDRYQYNSATAYLAGAVVEQVSDLTLSAYADQHLFGPLGISQYFWTKGPNNTTYGMGGLYLTARDFAKLGELYLRKGIWNGNRILSEAWVDRSLQSYFPVSGPPDIQTGYGWLWLVAQRTVHGRNFDVFFASGNGGNIMAIVPELDLLVSIQQSAYGRGYPHFRAFTAIDGIIKATFDRPVLAP